ncbi:MAG: galactose-1-phosphate uridyl transferase [Peltula sp. TS41687]|nr:MAG: galactose-1-phosphate uridyl transferase [Peltula sp. TS41687]
MSNSVLEEISHRRYNPLRDSWILVAAHRSKRPWQGQQEAVASETELPKYDPSCYLCPGNQRSQGHVNPKYDKLYIFVNDYSAVKEQQAEYVPEDDDALSSQLLKAESVKGTCYVIPFSPLHHLTLADMSMQDLVLLIKAWTGLYASHVSSSSPLAEIARTKAPLLLDGDCNNSLSKPSFQEYRYIQIFENKGAAMGCSNPHPHCQAWLTTSLPDELAIELKHLQKYRREHDGAHLLQDYARLETRKEERVVFQNDAFVAVCPWWAIWPFEILIVSKAHRRALIELDEHEMEQLAEMLGEITRRYDNLFETHFPYGERKLRTRTVTKGVVLKREKKKSGMGIHQAPLSGTREEIDASYFHMHFYPPLLRSATVRKFLVGYEMLAEPQRDITPEQAAARLRNCGGELYRRV